MGDRAITFSLLKLEETRRECGTNSDGYLCLEIAKKKEKRKRTFPVFTFFFCYFRGQRVSLKRDDDYRKDMDIGEIGEGPEWLLQWIRSSDYLQQS